MEPLKDFATRRGVSVNTLCDLSIDPGTCTGWAQWRSIELVGCGIGEPPFNRFGGCAVIEKPQVYPNHPVPPNDLITLAIQVGRYAELSWINGRGVGLVLPHEWKGNLPKDVCHARILQKLSPSELEVIAKAREIISKSYQHNMLDAIGIGLYSFRKVKI